MIRVRGNWELKRKELTVAVDQFDQRPGLMGNPCGLFERAMGRVD